MSNLQGDYWTGAHSMKREPENQEASILAMNVIEGVEPLDPKANAWPPKTVPDAIHEVLFGQADAAKAEMHTYAILDAAKITNLPELLSASGLEHRCLFKGAALDDLSGVAPWVVLLEEEASLTKNLFTKSEAMFHFWDAEPGIYLRSEASLAEICTHFRRFTKVKDDQGKWLFFRYWDVLTAQVYFEGVQGDASRINPFFGLPKRQGLEMIALNSRGRALHMIGPIVEDGPIRPQAPTFDQSDRQLLEEVSYHALSREISDWLRIEYAAKFDIRPASHTHTVADHIVETGRRLNLSLKEEFAFLGQMMATSGGWFVHNGYPAEIRAVLQGDPAIRLRALIENYATIYSKTPQAELIAQLEDVRVFLTKLPLVERVIPKHFQAFCRQFLRASVDDVAALLAGSRNRLKLLNLSNERKEGQAMVLTLMLGPRFFEDPFHTWSQLPVEEAIDAAWEMTVG